MSTPRFNHLIRWIFLLFLGLASSLAQAQTNGGLESLPDFTGWTKSNFYNPGLTGSAPFNGTNIVSQTPGNMRDLTLVLPSGTDAFAPISYPRFGSKAAVVNYKQAAPADSGDSNNGNTLTQTYTLPAADLADGLVHIRFAFAPVLENPGHADAEQPYFYVGVKDNTTGVMLYDNLNFSQATGIWQTAASGWVYTPWQVKDIALSASYVGHSVTVTFTAAGCSQGGHGGHVYVDGLAPTINGLWVSAAANKTKVAPGDTITYTYTVHNDSGATRNAVTLAATAPAQTTFVSNSDLGNHGALAAGATYTATMIVRVDAGATGSIVHDNFFTTSTEEPALYGPTLTLPVSGPSTNLVAAVTSAAHTVCNQVKFIVTATNSGPATAKNATASFALPANSTFVSATPSTGTVTGTAPVLANFGDLANGASATVTVIVQTTNLNTLTGNATVAGDFTDLNAANDTASSTFTQPAALSISTNPASGSYFNGTSCILTVAASGGWGTKSYQWYRGASGVTTTPVGGNSTSYTVPTGTDGSYSYWVRVTDVCSTVVGSDVAAILVYSTRNITASAGANGSISPTGVTAVTHGSNQSYTITPGTGYHVADLLVDGASAGAVTSYTFTNVTTTHTIVASFAINTYTLSYTAGANGTLTGTTPQTVNYNASGSTVTAVPATGYHFTAWSDGLATASRTDAAVTGAISVTASFAINTYTLSYTAGANGTLTGTVTQAVNHGASGTAVTAVPNMGYHFTAWSDGVATASRTDAAVTGAISVTASFAINTFTIQSSVVGSGQAYPAGTLVVAFDSEILFVFVPGAGKRVGNVLVDGVSLGPVLSYTFTSVRANHVISVVFDEAGRFTVVGNPTPLGSIAPGQTFANAGDCLSVYITPDRGFHVTDVQLNGISVGAVTEYQIASVKENVMVTATFAADEFKVTTTAIGNGEISPAFVQGLSSGADLTIHFLPADGCVVQDVQIDGRSLGAVSSYTFQNVQTDCTVVVRFRSR